MTIETVLAIAPKVKHPNESLGMGASFAELLAAGETIDTVDRIIVQSSIDFVNALDDTVDVVSSSAGDTTQTLTVYGLNDNGETISEAITLTGTTAHAGTKTFASVLQVKLDLTAVGTVTVRKGGTTTALAALVPAELTVPRLLITDEDVNSVTMFNDDGTSIAVGEGVFFTVAGGRNGVDYRITVDVTTDTDNVRTGVLPLEVRDGSL